VGAELGVSHLGNNINWVIEKGVLRRILGTMRQ
jgi:hypothetical protein